ncbi:hypothetical protein RN001_003567 [Aquatica leii]|uniref:DUF4806 domain-containing protein n=1 Tax=Aquatica leii TaxID=1421715 RepID=A0AAN7SE32_9COLE|nr:hypothetical protein RN001_003567 [Aquatica leii]
MVGHQEATWTIVQFIEEFGQPVECVPTKWIVGDTSFWPCRDVTKAIKNQEDVSEQWNCFKIRQLGKPCNDYLVARCMLNKAQDTSDLSGCEGEVSQKRKRFPRRVSSSEEDEEFEDRTRLPNFPASPELVHSTLPKNINAKIYKKQRIDLRKTCITSKISKCVNDSTAKTFGSDSEISPNNNFQQRFFRELALIKIHLKKLQEIVANINRGGYISKTNNVDNNVLETFPIDNDEQLGILEASLASRGEFKTRLVKYLATLHLNIHILFMLFTKRILRLVFNDTFASRFSWCAEKRKMNFSNLQLAQVIIKSVQCHNNTFKDLNIVRSIQNWLRHALARNNSYDLTKRILSKLISNEVAAKYNWIGLKKEKIFSELLLSQIVMPGVKVIQTATAKCFEDSCKNWFRRAKERLN